MTTTTITTVVEGKVGTMMKAIVARRRAFLLVGQTKSRISVPAACAECRRASGRHGDDTMIAATRDERRTQALGPPLPRRSPPAHRSVTMLAVARARSFQIPIPRTVGARVLDTGMRHNITTTATAIDPTQIALRKNSTDRTAHLHEIGTSDTETIGTSEDE